MPLRQDHPLQTDQMNLRHMRVLAEAVRSGAVAPGAEVPVTATIDIGALQFTHVVTATLQAPDADD